jgi:glycine/sarcosine N-methyltransferase
MMDGAFFVFPKEDVMMFKPTPDDADPSELAEFSEQYDTSAFYNAVVDHYHLFYRDWQATVDREGMTLRKILSGRRNILDASCGTGTQSIALAKQGFKVTAADISGAMLDKARENAREYGIESNIQFVNAGFLELPQHITGTFHAVITKGNALPHLLTDDEIRQAIRNFHDLLVPGGLLLIGIRDYDTILEDRLRFVPGQFHDDPAQRDIFFDIWDYDDGPPVVITFHKFRVHGSGDNYQVVKNSVKYRALLKAELEAMLQEAGFTDIKAETQMWELIFTAVKK